MANFTPNVNLEKPLGSEHYLIPKFNANMDKIDAEFDNKVDKELDKGLSSNDYTDAEKTKLNQIEAGANNYAHPVSHLPSIIVQDANNRFVTDAEKAAWNSKQEKAYANAGAHNSIYRGKYLGNVVTAAQYLAISSGTFDDLFIGDYWTIGGINYRIAGFNYFYNVGDTALTVNHAVIVPDLQMYDAQMNATSITTGGYAGSLMRTTNLASAISTIESAFAGHVLTHRQLLTNATTDGKASGWAWYDAKVELMNEVMVYGSSAWGVSSIGNGFNVGSSNGQLPLFALRHDMMHNRQNWWLRDAVSAAGFAIVASNGSANAGNASYSVGVCPAFSIS